MTAPYALKRRDEGEWFAMFGRRLRVLRLWNGLSEAEMARRPGRHPARARRPAVVRAAVGTVSDVTRRRKKAGPASVVVTDPEEIEALTLYREADAGTKRQGYQAR